MPISFHMRKNQLHAFLTATSLETSRGKTLKVKIYNKYIIKYSSYEILEAFSNVPSAPFPQIPT